MFDTFYDIEVNRTSFSAKVQNGAEFERIKICKKKDYQNMFEN